MTTAGVKVSEILDAARRGRALLAPEIAGYLVLGAADLLSRSPIWLDEAHCGLLVDGGRVVVAPAPPATPAVAERGLRDLLQRLLETAQGRAPALNAVAYGAGKGTIPPLISELESALIPVNRAAAARALSRLARETVRARISPDPGSVARPSAAPPDAEDTQPMPASELPTTESGSEPAPPLSPNVDEGDVVEVSDEPGQEMTAGETIDIASQDAAEPAPAEPAPVEPAPVEPAPAEPGPAVLSLVDAQAVEVARSKPEPSQSANPEPVSSEPIDDERAAGSPEIDESHPTRSPPPPLPAVETPLRAPVASAPRPLAAPPRPGGSAASGRASFTRGAARGVDELIQDFMASTSRKEERVAHDLRRITGTEGERKPVVPPQPPEPPPIAAPSAAPSAPGESALPSSSGAAELYTSTPPPSPLLAQSVAPAADDDPFARRSTRRKVYVLLALVSLVTLGTVAVLRLGPGLLSGQRPEAVEQQRAAAAPAVSVAARAAAGPCRATLVVADVPHGAEVLVRSGLAPLDVDRVPSGARLEFVALYDGYAPKRAVVPRGVAWDERSGKPRFELPIQLDKSKPKGGALDAWPAGDPSSVGGQGRPATVHVVTNPRGAEVWMVAGGAPEAKLESLECGAGLDLMVAGTSRGQPFRRRLRVDAAQLTPEPPASTVTSRVSAP